MHVMVCCCCYIIPYDQFHANTLWLCVTLIIFTIQMWAVIILEYLDDLNLIDIVVFFSC